MFYLHSTPPGNQFQQKNFLRLPEKSTFFWNLIEKRFSWSSGIFSLRGQWNGFSEETWNFQKRGMFSVAEQKLLDWCYHILFLRAGEDIFVGKPLVEQYLEVIVCYLNGNYVAAAFVRAAPGMSRKLNKMNENGWDKTLGKLRNCIFSSNFKQKLFNWYCLICAPCIHMFSLSTYFLKTFGIKTNLFKYWTKCSSLVSWKQQSTCP